MAEVLALIDDLFFQAKVVETAKHLGVDLRTCTTADALMAEIDKEKPKLVVVDLNARNDPIGAVERLSEPAEISRRSDSFRTCRWTWQKGLARQGAAMSCLARNSRAIWQPSWRK